jgi:hypothetical protein
MTGLTGTAFQLSVQQERLWTRRGENAEALCIQCDVRISGPFDRSRLETAIAGVVRNHEILRTSFQRQAGMKLPFQVIRDESSLNWNLSDEAFLSLDFRSPAPTAEVWKTWSRRSERNMPVRAARPKFFNMPT